MPKPGTVYILGSHAGTLYIGVTSDLQKRVWQHKSKAIEGFSGRYKVDRLLHFEVFDDIRDAIAREKQLKSWRREKKLAVIEAHNLNHADLAAGWFDLNERNDGNTR